MQPSSGFLSVVVSALLATALLPAQDVQKEMQSGPAKGTRLGPLRVAVRDGAAAGSTRDLAPELSRGPAAILFVHELTRNVAPLVRAFDTTGADLAVLSVHTACVLLAGDRTAAEQRAPVVTRALQLAAPILVSADGAEGPGGYALNRKAELTLVLANDGVVTDSLAFVATGAHDVELLQFALDALAGPPPPDDALAAAIERTLPQDRERIAQLVLRLERQRRLLADRLAAQRGQPATDQAPRRPAMRDETSRTAAPTQAGDAPDRERPDRERPDQPLAQVADAELRAVLRRIVRRDADAAALDEAFAALDARVAGDAALREQAGRAATAILAVDTYGNAAARERLRRWLAR